jgi:predicted DNA-binding WGR domain protein
MANNNGNTTTLVLIDPTVNAKKFWTVAVFGSTVTCTWGRIGTGGQSKNFPFGSTWAAKAYADKKRWEKLDKGYVRIS